METTVIIIILCAIVYTILHIAIKEVRDKNEKRFNRMYENLECIIDRWPVNKTSKLKINSYFEDIKKVRWGDSEKVKVLWNTFRNKYTEEEDEFSIQDGDLDEFSPENVFRK